MIILEKENFSRNDLEYLKILEVNEVFLAVVKSIRQIIGIPINGCQVIYDNDNKIQIPEYSDTVRENVIRNQTQLSQSVDDLISGFNLPKRWEVAITTVILFNTAVAPNDQQFPAVEVEYKSHFSEIFKKIGVSKLKDRDHSSVTIHINERITQKGVKNEIKRLKKEIVRSSERIGSSVPPYFKNLELYLEIYRLRNGGMTFPQISTFLSDKYPDSGIVADDNTVKHYFDRIVKKVNQIPSEKLKSLYLAKYLHTEGTN